MRRGGRRAAAPSRPSPTSTPISSSSTGCSRPRRHRGRPPAARAGLQDRDPLPHCEGRGREQGRGAARRRRRLRDQAVQPRRARRARAGDPPPHGQRLPGDVLRFADVMLDEAATRSSAARRAIDLTATEFQLLRYFLLNPRRVLSKGQILQNVWRYDFGGNANVVETYVSYLRRKLDAPGPPLIRTVRQAGYMLETGERSACAALAAHPAAARGDRARGGRARCRRRGRPTRRSARSSRQHGHSLNAAHVGDVPGGAATTGRRPRRGGIRAGDGVRRATTSSCGARRRGARRAVRSAVLGREHRRRRAAGDHRLSAQDTVGGDRVRFLTVPAVSGGGRYRVRASTEPQTTERSSHRGAARTEDSTLHRLLPIELLVTVVVLAALAALACGHPHQPPSAAADRETAAAITAGDLPQRVEHADPQTEVGRAGHALNTMLDRDRAPSSVASVGARCAASSPTHRTSCGRRWPPCAPTPSCSRAGAAARPADLERSMSGISREAERMSLLVDDLLLLARLDEGRPLEREPVELAATSSARQSTRRARSSRTGRSTVSLEPATVPGDRDRLRQVVDNLLANVRAHTPPGTPVRRALDARTARRRRASPTPAPADRGAGEPRLRALLPRRQSRARASGGAGLGLVDRRRGRAGARRRRVARGRRRAAARPS